MAAKPTQTSGSLEALDSFAGSIDGREVRFVKGEPVSPDNPAVAKWPKLFGPQVYRHNLIANIEQATAAPGEKRA